MTIQTIEGVFIVPAEKIAALIQWLKQNAVKAGEQRLGEVRNNDGYNGQQLLVD